MMGGAGTGGQALRGVGAGARVHRHQCGADSRGGNGWGGQAARGQVQAI